MVERHRRATTDEWPGPPGAERTAKGGTAWRGAARRGVPTMKPRSARD